MSCYANMIARIKYVKQNVKEDTNSLIVWALGTYPVEREDYNIKMTLFALISSDNRDYESQAIFVKDNFFSMIVSSSTYLTILNKVEESNKCLLKVSLLGIPQKALNYVQIEDFDDSVEEFFDDFVENLKRKMNNDISVVSDDCFSRFESNFEASTGTDCKNAIDNFVDGSQVGGERF
ncbi:hypothetical protein F8M41_022381 [Gigaspora margarita]|uniref:Uncharacterized protein n=1 Tax=Gigaspora margarita TaxID=4874 RepID=A0A8H4B165_GIGMA|nr:hypothetical protein F8M41_022381 [Gigaspora margarita]